MKLTHAVFVIYWLPHSFRTVHYLHIKQLYFYSKIHEKRTAPHSYWFFVWPIRCFSANHLFMSEYFMVIIWVKVNIFRRSLSGYTVSLDTQTPMVITLFFIHKTPKIHISNADLIRRFRRIQWNYKTITSKLSESKSTEKNALTNRLKIGDFLATVQRFRGVNQQYKIVYILYTTG